MLLAMLAAKSTDPHGIAVGKCLENFAMFRLGAVEATCHRDFNTNVTFNFVTKRVGNPTEMLTLARSEQPRVKHAVIRGPFRNIDGVIDLDGFERAENFLDLGNVRSRAGLGRDSAGMLLDHHTKVEDFGDFRDVERGDHETAARPKND